VKTGQSCVLPFGTCRTRLAKSSCPEVLLGRAVYRTALNTARPGRSGRPRLPGASWKSSPDTRRRRRLLAGRRWASKGALREHQRGTGGHARSVPFVRFHLLAPPPCPGLGGPRPCPRIRHRCSKVRRVDGSSPLVSCAKPSHDRALTPSSGAASRSGTKLKKRPDPRCAAVHGHYLRKPLGGRPPSCSLRRVLYWSLASELGGTSTALR
jgi:hypothetical protein